MTKPHAIDSSAVLSPFAREVLELYASELSDVRFPDLDLAALRALASEVLAEQEEVDRLESEARDARERVAERSATLHARAERALSYARIYAEGNPSLSERVSAIRPQGPSQSALAQKKRGRPRKDEAQLEVLERAAE
jgi:predicted  nucleic acid-binding Zn-ribbon protein